MKKIAFIVCVCVSYFTHAQSIGLGNAQKVAQKFYSSKLKNNDNVLPSEVIYVNKLGISGRDTAFFVFQIRKRGFVIISNDRATPPILGYGIEEGGENIDIVNPTFEYFMNGHKQQILDIKTKKAQPKKETEYLQRIQQEWNKLLSNNLVLEKANSSSCLAPLLTTNWAQGGVYNDFCPTNSCSNGEQTLVGCVAVAMGQIMRYHRFPSVGRYYNAYNWNGSTQIGDFGNTYYDWSNMPSSINNSSPAIQKQAIGKLLHHIGIAVDMNYGCNISLSFSIHPNPTINDAKKAFERNFKYNVTTLERASYATSLAWFNVLQAKLSQNIPLYYKGEDTNGNGGHAWVCDGCDNNQMLHMNWGWGQLNGFFSVENFLISSININFFNNQSVLVCTPNLTVTPTAVFTIKDKNGNWSTNDVVELNSGQIVEINPTGSVTGKTYFVSIEPSNANWGTPDHTNEKARWLTPQDQMSNGIDSNISPYILGNLNLTRFYQSFGKSFTNGYYRIKLATGDPWTDKTKLIKVGTLVSGGVYGGTPSPYIESAIKKN